MRKKSDEIGEIRVGVQVESWRGSAEGVRVYAGGGGKVCLQMWSIGSSSSAFLTPDQVDALIEGLRRVKARAQE